MRQWVVWLTAIVLLFVISGCSSEVEGIPIDTESVQPSIEETEPPVILLDNLEYWDVVQDEIVDMLRSHNLYIDIISHAYPCVQFYVEPGIVAEDGKTVASGLTQVEYKEVFESVKSDLHMILDKYKIGKPKTIFHGCNSIVEIFFIIGLLTRTKSMTGWILIGWLVMAWICWNTIMSTKKILM